MIGEYSVCLGAFLLPQCPQDIMAIEPQCARLRPVGEHVNSVKINVPGREDRFRPLNECELIGISDPRELNVANEAEPKA